MKNSYSMIKYLSLVGLLTIIGLNPSASNAADCTASIAELTISASSAINERQAQAELSDYMLNLTSVEASKSVPPTTLINETGCFLDQQKQNADLIERFKAPLKALGSQLLTSSDPTQTRVAIEQINQTIARDAGTGFIRFPGAQNRPIEIDLYGQLLGRSCSAGPTTACANDLRLAKQLWWISGEYRRLADGFNTNDKNASLAFNQRLNKRWRSYKDDTIKLWPHEVALNSVVYKPSSQGLSSPPNYKLLSLRPSLGLTYLSDQNTQFQPTINIDLLGVYWWQYDENSIASKGQGIAASLIWDGDDTSLGLTYHLNPKWSVTAAKDDENDLVLSVSFQLAFLFFR